MEVFRIKQQCPTITVRLRWAGRRQNQWELHPLKSSDPPEECLMLLEDQSCPCCVPSAVLRVSLRPQLCGAGTASLPAQSCPHHGLCGAAAAARTPLRNRYFALQLHRLPWLGLVYFFLQEKGRGLL